MSNIRAAIIGYGNLGKSVEQVIASQPDIDLVGVFSRRESLDTSAPVIPIADIEKHTDNIDVLYLCLGSATDMPEQAANLAKLYNTVDTYDNHNEIPRHRAEMDAAAKESGHVAVISTGWDPGMFSLNRVYADAVMTDNDQHTFWGPGLSQGHSDALRRIDGVKKAVQYTIPAEDALDKARTRQGEGITGKNAHLRQCWIVAEDGADLEAIENSIRTMPDYFVGYEVEVNFITDEVFDAEHTGMPHGGHVVTAGKIGDTQHLIEYTLKLERNPDFTAGAMVAYGRAAHRLAQAGETGARTVLEIAPYLIHPASLDDLVAKSV
ncbi:diaminopimelate dehydrogenase [Corynebacterium epidermidicanis]|uniref:Meso-diaminopimelate D-dehydrogenase n=1 Tax=Corynebacterium epidermidicanis TaxID=1050174 RepID=A0A0G3GWN6_9CORY|nr:diaminopimelate dehydrogenase [Corynebacterium epidermidicanis]AKK03943.1 diaminopimelate dehydrogenase [Corynebacterium epidermidicanis]